MTREQPTPADEAISQLLQERDGAASMVVLRDGVRLTVFNIAWESIRERQAST